MGFREQVLNLFWGELHLGGVEAGVVREATGYTPLA